MRLDMLYSVVGEASGKRRCAHFGGLLSKLAKSTYPFTGAQPPLPPTEHRTVPSRDDVITFFKTHERVSWSLTELIDVPWTDIDVDALTPSDIFVAESALLVESNSPDYVANLIEYFKADQDVCDFIMMWGIEEWKHYYVLADYMTKVRTAIAARAADRGGRDVDELVAAVREKIVEGQCLLPGAIQVVNQFPDSPEDRLG